MFSPPLLSFRSNIYPSRSSRERNNELFNLRSFSGRNALPSLNPIRRIYIYIFVKTPFHNNTCMNNKTHCKGEVAEPPGYCSAVGFRRKNLPRSQAPLTRLKLSQGNVATAPARAFQGLCSHFRQMKDFWGSSASEVDLRKYLEVSFYIGGWSWRRE